jgi:hypothetical protein
MVKRGVSSYRSETRSSFMEKIRILAQRLEDSVALYRLEMKPYCIVMLSSSTRPK